MYVVSYDISEDRLRGKVAKTLEGFGIRVQYSVFECRLDERQYRELYAKLQELSRDMEEGSIRFYEICGKCEKKITVIGEISRQQEQMAEDVIVV